MKATKRNYVSDTFDVLQGNRTKKDVAHDYLNEVLDGHIVHITETTTWGSEFVKLCKAHKGLAIYRNFPQGKCRGEYSIYPTHLYNEIKMN